MDVNEQDRAVVKNHLTGQILNAIAELYKTQRTDDREDRGYAARLGHLYNYLPPGILRVQFAEAAKNCVRFATTTRFFLDDAVVASNHLPMYTDMLVNLLWNALENYNPQAAPMEMLFDLQPGGELSVAITWIYALGDQVLDEVKKEGEA